MTSTKEKNELCYQDFLAAVLKAVKEKMGDLYEVDIRKVLKNNSVELDACIIREPEASVAPNVYLNDMYGDYRLGTPIESIADTVIGIYEEYKDAFDENEVSEMFDYETMKDRIVFRLVNYERNSAVLQNTPHIRFDDLAVEFVCLLEHRGAYGSVRVTNSHLSDWEIELNDLVELASENTPRIFPATFRSMQEMLCEMLRMRIEAMSAEGEDDGRADDVRKLIDLLEHEEASDVFPDMYVLTTEQGVNGAACMLYDGLMDKIREKLGEDFYILPSSINEIIIVPDSRAKAEELAIMIPEVNREQVPLQEILSDKLYHYPELRIVM